MESSYISILESFPLVSVIMPFYGSTDEMFLVLSSLCVSTRRILSKNYPEFRRFMLDYSKVKKLSIKELLEIDLPLDLFVLYINELSLNKGVEDLIALINKLTNKEGCYFDSHYMSGQICFDKISVDTRFIQDLYPYVDSLKEIKAFNHSKGLCNKYQSSTLIDLIYLKNIFYKDIGVIKICYFEDCEFNQVDPIFQHFKRVGWLRFDNVVDADTKLDSLKLSNIDAVEELDFNMLNIQSLEEVSDPQYFNYSILSLRYSETRCGCLNDSILHNISKINPRKLYLYGLGSISSAARIFSYLNNDMFINISTDEYYELRFKRTIFLLKHNDITQRLYCDEIGFNFGDSIKPNDIMFHQNCIRINDFGEMGCENLRKNNTSLKDTFEDLSLASSESGNYILIPLNKLAFIKLSRTQVLNLLSSDSNKKYFLSLSSNTEVILELNSIEDAVKFNKVSELVPSHSQLNLNDVIYYGESDEENNFNKSVILNLASKFRLRSIFIKSIESIIDILLLILSYPSVKNSIKNLHISKSNYYDCLEVLSLCSSCSQLETIYIKYVKVGGKEEDIDKAIDQINLSCKYIQRIHVTSE